MTVFSVQMKAAEETRPEDTPSPAAIRAGMSLLDWSTASVVVWMAKPIIYYAQTHKRHWQESKKQKKEYRKAYQSPEDQNNAFQSTELKFLSFNLYLQYRIRRYLYEKNIIFYWF